MVRNTPEVKQLNKELIRRAIQKNEKCTKVSISKEANLSVATCNTIFNEMLEDGEIIRVDQEEIYLGRPASQFAYNPDYQHVLVMYIQNEQGVNTIEYAVADAVGNQIYREQVHPEIITYDLIKNLVENIMKEDTLIQGMAFGIPGVSHHGVIEYCDVESMIGVDVVGQIQEQFGIKVEIRNDMDFVSNGVYHTVFHHGGNLATMYFPMKEASCVGCGFIIDGKVLRGHSKFAGELSYIAEAFGISREKQAEMLMSRAAFRELVAQMILIVCGTIDPEVIMLMGNEIDEEDLAAIRKHCSKVISDKHIPRLIVDNQIAEYYINGLIRVALDQRQFPITQ